jgi:glycosyltransferase involved in cell wall biosynthesis
MSAIEPRRLRIAMVGTRGVPAAYGGFETAIEEIGQRLAARGHDVTVYCRSANRSRPRTHLGMTLVHLPALKTKSIETLSHTALSAIHLAFGKRQDAAFVFNAANAPFVPLIRSRGAATAVHVDGLEWKRGKWGRMGKKYYRMAEQMAVKDADALISDAQGIADYYDHEFGIPTELLTYGANILRDPASDRLAELGLEPGQYHLVVARFEPENHVDVIVDGYTASGATLPLVVVGSAPYSAAYTDRIEQVASADPRIQRLGGVWDQEQLDQLYAHALTYLHGHSVGGTNPSLLRAMGAATATLANDNVFNRDVLGEDGRFWSDAAGVAALVEGAEANAAEAAAIGRRLQERAEETYDWDAIADGYEELAARMVRGYSTRGMSRGVRSATRWEPELRPADAGRTSFLLEESR